MQLPTLGPTFSLYALYALALLGAAVALLWYRPRRKSYPPGPPGLPIIGNLFDMPSDFQWLTFFRWSKDYASPVIHTRIFGQSIVVLNSHQSVKDVLEKRSSLYSDRPRSVMFQEIMALADWALPFMGYTPTWRTQRQLFHSSFHPSVIVSYHPVLNQCTQKLLVLLSESPEGFRDHLDKHAGRIILKAVYGHDIKDENDRLIWLIDEHFRIINERCDIGSFYLVDYVPILKHLPAWVPGFKFQKIGAEYREVADELVNSPFQEVHDLWSTGKAAASIVAQQIEQTSQIPNLTDVRKTQEYLQTKIMAATAYPAGKDTTSATIAAVILGLVLNPHVLKKAQQEIDEVTRGVRLPGFEDRNALHYVHCIVLEALRWFPAAPTAFAHRLLQDDEYQGHFIPKGSLVLGNTWALTRDEEMFPDPETFNPDRFGRGPKGEPNSAEACVTATFGYGRRICPGRWFALDVMWLTVAQMLAVFDVLRDINEQGEELIPEVNFTHGLVCHPKAFPCRIVPRSAQAMSLLQD